jgi:hypothetical protein
MQPGHPLPNAYQGERRRVSKKAPLPPSPSPCEANYLPRQLVQELLKSGPESPRTGRRPAAGQRLHLRPAPAQLVELPLPRPHRRGSSLSYPGVQKAMDGIF